MIPKKISSKRFFKISFYIFALESFFLNIVNFLTLFFVHHFNLNTLDSVKLF